MCGNFTPIESLQANFAKFTKLYFFTVKMVDEDDDDIIAATYLLLSCTTQLTRIPNYTFVLNRINQINRCQDL